MDVRFAVIGDDNPRNAKISTDQTEAVPDKNGVNFDEREVLIRKDNFRPNGMGAKPWGEI